MQLIHSKSNFEEFYKILDASILNSENKKNITSNLFIKIQRILAEMLDDYNKQQTNKIINDIYKKLCNYIDTTPYQIISKDKFTELNSEINKVSKKLLSEWINNIKKEFDDKLNETILKIAKIIKKNSEEINKVFIQKNQDETNLEIYRIRITLNSLMSNFMTSAAYSTSLGAGLFAIGNGILPGIGGIVGSIMGGLIGLIVSLPASNKKRTF